MIKIREQVTKRTRYVVPAFANFAIKRTSRYPSSAAVTLVDRFPAGARDYYYYYYYYYYHRLKNFPDGPGTTQLPI